MAHGCSLKKGNMNSVDFKYIRTIDHRPGTTDHKRNLTKKMKKNKRDTETHSY